MASPLAIIGCGWAGLAIAREARRQGREVRVWRRSAEGRRELSALGFACLEGTTIEEMARPDVLADHEIVLAFPPESQTELRIRQALNPGQRVLLLSSTAVYGRTEGDLTEETPTAADSARGVARLESESRWREQGAVVLRVAGIYGVERGIHLRLLKGVHRIPGDGRNRVSRIHVDDLATLTLAALERGPAGAVFHAADERALTHLEAAEPVCAALGLPLPSLVPLESVDESLRGNRWIRSELAQRTLGWRPRYPTWIQGWAELLARRSEWPSG